MSVQRFHFPKPQKNIIKLIDFQHVRIPKPKTHCKTKCCLNVLEEHKAKGTMPKWNKGFVGGFQPLRENGQAYKGFNAFYLGLIVGVKGYTSPYFFTFNKLLEIMGYKKKDLNSKSG